MRLFSGPRTESFDVENTTINSAARKLVSPPIYMVQVEADPVAGEIQFLILVDTDLPERIAIGRELVYNDTLYPGATNLEVQVLNTRSKDIIISGTFNDRMYKGTAFAKDSTEGDRHAQIQAQRLDRMFKSQIEVRFQWGSLIEAYALITELDLDYKDLAEVKYSMRLMVTREQAAVDITKKSEIEENTVQIQEASRALQIVEWYSPPIDIERFASEDYVEVFNAYEAARDYINKASEAYSRVVQSIDSAIGDIDKVVNLVNTAISLIESARTKLAQLRRKFDSWNASSRSAMNRIRNLLNIQRWVNTIRRSAFVADRKLLLSRRALHAMADSFVLTVHRCKEGDTLTKLSQLYYNNPLYIADIIQMNKLETTQLEVGQLLMIPKRDM